MTLTMAILSSDCDDECSNIKENMKKIVRPRGQFHAVITYSFICISAKSESCLSLSYKLNSVIVSWAPCILAQVNWDPQEKIPIERPRIGCILFNSFDHGHTVSHMNTANKIDVENCRWLSQNVLWDAHRCDSELVCVLHARVMNICDWCLSFCLNSESPHRAKLWQKPTHWHYSHGSYTKVYFSRYKPH